MKRSQSGYTIVDILFIATILSWVAVALASVYAIIKFILSAH